MVKRLRLNEKSVREAAPEPFPQLAQPLIDVGAAVLQRLRLALPELRPSFRFRDQGP